MKCSYESAVPTVAVSEVHQMMGQLKLLTDAINFGKKVAFRLQAFEKKNSRTADLPVMMQELVLSSTKRSILPD